MCMTMKGVYEYLFVFFYFIFLTIYFSIRLIDDCDLFTVTIKEIRKKKKLITVYKNIVLLF